jgi:hypothetical protein
MVGVGLFLFSKMSRLVLGPPHFLFIWHQGSFPGVEQLESEVKHSFPSTAKVEDKWSYTPIPPICLNGTDREN